MNYYRTYDVITFMFVGNKKAVFNLKHVNGVADIGGPSVQLGAEEKYYPTCFLCYTKQLAKSGHSFCDIDISQIQL